jgi:hypothetical protein
LIEAILTDMNLKTIGTILKNNRNTKDWVTCTMLYMHDACNSGLMGIQSDN